MPKKSKIKAKKYDCYIETTTLGERGQVVIPKEIREMLDLKIGEPLLVMPHNGSVIMMPKKITKHFIETLSKHINV